MAYHPTPVDRAGDALRRITSLVTAASLISSGSSLCDPLQEETVVLDLLAVAEQIGNLGQAAMDEIEGAMKRGISPTMTA